MDQVVVACDDMDLDGILSSNIDVTVSLDLCSPGGASVTMELKDSADGIDFSHTIDLGTESTDVPTPVMIGIPYVGDVALDIAASMSVNANTVELKLGFDACATVLGFTVCGSELLSELPVNIIDEPFAWSDACGGGPAPPPSPPGPGPPPSPAPAPPSPPGEYHYGDPHSAAGCESDEDPTSITGVSGEICAPRCSSEVACPTDPPAGTTARGMCVLSAATASSPWIQAQAARNSTATSTPTGCALICKGGLQCPPGASCEPIQDTAICT